MNSRLDLRLEAIRLVTLIEGVTPESLIKTAKEVEKYILGEATLPEVYDSMELMRSATDFAMNNFKSK